MIKKFRYLFGIIILIISFFVLRLFFNFFVTDKQAGTSNLGEKIRNLFTAKADAQCWQPPPGGGGGGDGGGCGDGGGGGGCGSSSSSSSY